MKTVVALALCVAACTAHMCLLEPKQRGSFTSQDLNNPGMNFLSILNVSRPCGHSRQVCPVRTEIKLRSDASARSDDEMCKDERFSLDSLSTIFQSCHATQYYRKLTVSC